MASLTTIRGLGRASHVLRVIKLHVEAFIERCGKAF
jgi:hypothetical protein